MTRCSIAIADDHELVARGLANLLAPFHTVSGVAHSGRELIELLARKSADCVLLDLSMPEQSGLEVLPELKRRFPETRVIMVSMHADRSLVQATISQGADGYVPKDAGLSELREAIETVLAGGQYLSPRLPTHGGEHSGLQACHPSLASLTPRQEEILMLIGDGLSSAAIGKAIGLTEATIAFHRATLRRKLGIESELGLHRFAVLIRAASPEVEERTNRSHSRMV